VFLGLEKSEYSAISAAITNVLKVVIGLSLLIAGYGLLSILILLAAVSALNAILNWVFLRYKLRIRLAAEKHDLSKVRRYVFSQSLPFLYIALMSKIYYKNDVLVLGWFKSDQVVGWYGGAYMAIDLLLLVGGALANAIYPILSRTYVSEPARAGRYYELLCKYVFLLFAPICIIVSAVGAKLIPLVLGKSFRNGIDALEVLIWMVLFETLTSVAGTVLCATGNQKKMAAVGTVVTILNLILTIILVRKYSYMGAAWTTTSTAVLNLLGASWLVARVIPGAKLHRALLGPVLAAAVMGLAVWGLGVHSKVIGLSLGIPLYMICLFAFRIISEEDKSIFRNLLVSRRRR